MSKTIYDGPAVDAYRSKEFFKFLEDKFPDVELMHENSSNRIFQQAIMLSNEGVALFYDIYMAKPYRIEGPEARVTVTAFGEDAKVGEVEKIILMEAKKYHSK